jgi:hypothetical protein
MSTTGKLFEKGILKIVQRHIAIANLIPLDYPGICLEKLRKTEKKNLRLVGVSAEFRNKHLPKTGL